MDCGISVSEFWELSLSEVYDIIQSFQRRLKEREKRKVEKVFILAEAIASYIAFSFSSKEDRDGIDLMQPWDRYPALFEEEREEFERYSSDAEFIKYKESRKRMADDHNRRRKEEGL